ncbi:MAG: glycosyltransferase family 4 protein [Planctomycetes bacterium]|nr:glycosyltransferase family 4 protein [Planctomycetota bacterium]
MRIAVLSYEYPPETGFGGIGTYSYYQARALAKLGHDVHVFAGATENGLGTVERDGLKITRIKREGWFHGALEGLRKRRGWWAENRLRTGYAAFEAFRHEHDRKPFDFIEAPECGADSVVTSTLLQVPTAIKFHSPARLIMNIYDTPRIDREVCSFVEQLGINQAEVLTSCSRFLADEVATKMHEPKPIHVIPNGIDVEMFDRDDGIDVYQRFDLPKDKKLIFFANRMEERKGVHILKEMVKETLAQYPQIAFVFAGRDLFGYMEKQILPWVKDNQLTDRFFYLGQLDLPAVRACLKAASIFLIPSLWENCPYSCIEAMTAGRAIVSSDCGGMPELIEDRRTGLLAKNGDPASFVQVLREMIEDDQLAARCGEAARKEVEKRLTDTGIAKIGVDTYQAFLDGAPRQAESQQDRIARVAAEAQKEGASAAEVSELRQRVAKLTAELDAAKQREAAVKLSREFRWGKNLLNVVTLGARRS